MDAILSHIPATPFNRLCFDFMVICDRNYCAAKILGLFEAWTIHRYTEIEQARHKNRVARRAGKEPCNDESTWLYNSVGNIAFHLLGEYSATTVKRALGLLLDRGFIKTRNSPYSEWDRTKQYQLQVEEIQTAIDGITEEQILEFYQGRDHLIKPQTISFVSRNKPKKSLEPSDARKTTVDDQSTVTDDRTCSGDDQYIYSSTFSSISSSPLNPPKGNSREEDRTEVKQNSQPIAEQIVLEPTIAKTEVRSNPATLPSDQEVFHVVNQDLGSDQLLRGGSFELEQFEARHFETATSRFDAQIQSVRPWRQVDGKIDPEFAEFVRAELIGVGIYREKEPTVHNAMRSINRREKSIDPKEREDLLIQWEGYQAKLAKKLENEQRAEEAKQPEIASPQDDRPIEQRIAEYEEKASKGDRLAARMANILRVNLLDQEQV